MTQCTKAETIDTVTYAKPIVNLAGKAVYFEDKQGTVGLSTILHLPSSIRFQPVKKPVVSFGVTTSYFWLKTTIRNETDEHLLLKIATTAVTDLWLYEVRDGSVVKSYHSGNWQPFAKRAVKDVHYLFPLAVPRDSTTTVYLKIMHLRGTQFPLLVGTSPAFYTDTEKRNLAEGIYFGIMLLMVFYNLFLYLSLRDVTYLYYVVYTFLMGFFNAVLSGFMFWFLYPSLPVLNRYEDIVASLMGISGILFAAQFLNTRKNAPVSHRLFMGLVAGYVLSISITASGNITLGTLAVETLSLVLVGVFFVAAYSTLRSGYRPAKFFLIAWTLLLLSVVVFILKDFNLLPYSAFTANSLKYGSAAEAMLLSLALANRINVYKKELMEAQQETLESLEQNRRLITEQNALLEKRVGERTVELRRANRDLVTALRELKETQVQLVQKEKMASLGELTAGIAHEIQNPLNFVNNFSEVSSELAEELKTEISNGDSDKSYELALDLKNNLEKIVYHCSRADSIVKGMLQHSRRSDGVKEPTDLNALVDEYLRLSYHGFRTKDKSFTAILETYFDDSVGKVYLVPQEIGRVLLNLFNNAFYAVQQKMKQNNGRLEPTVSVSTKKDGDQVIISVRDNGTGMSQKVMKKVFQPFFTTKPVGEGTGLGLSISYDIVTKTHGGQLTVETKEGEGTIFTVVLPLPKWAQQDQYDVNKEEA